MLSCLYHCEVAVPGILGSKALIKEAKKKNNNLLNATGTGKSLSAAEIDSVMSRVSSTDTIHVYYTTKRTIDLDKKVEGMKKSLQEIKTEQSRVTSLKDSAVLAKDYKEYETQLKALDLKKAEEMNNIQATQVFRQTFNKKFEPKDLTNLRNFIEGEIAKGGHISGITRYPKKLVENKAAAIGIIGTFVALFSNTASAAKFKNSSRFDQSDRGIASEKPSPSSKRITNSVKARAQ
jgi:superfamily II DNA helicase RecQ